MPAAGQPGFLLDGDEIEWGLGIHGEPGVERAGAAPGAPGGRPAGRPRSSPTAASAPGDRVALLVNGLGATPPMELSIVADAAARDLRGRGVRVERVWAGNFLTALDMAGCSLSVLPVDDDLLAALDAPTTAPAWPATDHRGGAGVDRRAGRRAGRAGHRCRPTIRCAGALESVAEALISVRDELTELDREVGDGDLGISLARGAAAVLADCPAYPGEAGPAAVLRADLGHAAAQHRRHVRAAVRDHAAARGPARRARCRGRRSPRTQSTWAARRLPRRRGRAVREVGGAEVGDRTMVDALRPAADAFERPSCAGGASWRDALAAAADAAAHGCGGDRADPGPAGTVELSG